MWSRPTWCAVIVRHTDYMCWHLLELWERDFLSTFIPNWHFFGVPKSYCLLKQAWSCNWPDSYNWFSIINLRLNTCLCIRQTSARLHTRHCVTTTMRKPMLVSQIFYNVYTTYAQGCWITSCFTKHTAKCSYSSRASNTGYLQCISKHTNNIIHSTNHPAPCHPIPLNFTLPHSIPPHSTSRDVKRDTGPRRLTTYTDGSSIIKKGDKLHLITTTYIIFNIETIAISHKPQQTHQIAKLNIDNVYVCGSSGNSFATPYGRYVFVIYSKPAINCNR